jgi:hypothetical protein
VDLLVGLGVHEVVEVTVAVHVLHLALVEHGALDVFLGPELLIRQGEGSDVAHPALDVGALVARRQVV